MKQLDTIPHPTLGHALLSLLVIALLLLPGAVETTAQPRQHMSSEKLAAHHPSFIRNDGQWNPTAKFLMRSPGLDLWITATGVVYDINRVEKKAGDNGPRLSSIGAEEIPTLRVHHAPVFITFEGADSGAAVLGSNPLEEYHNYFIGSDRSRWAAHVPLFEDARIQGLYDGIDALFYLDEGRPRYDLVVAPGADPSIIGMKLEGAAKVSVGSDGALKIATTLGTIEQRELFAYQMVGGAKRRVPCAFVVGVGARVGFEMGRYDRTRPLVIDPLVYSTYLGGSEYDTGLDIAIDDSGNAYVAGGTASTDFPTRNPLQGSNAGGDYDMIVTKLTSGGGIAYTTYLGGTAHDLAACIAVDGSGNAYVGGRTSSGNFPTLNAMQARKSVGFDAAVVKLTSSGALAYSTFLGGDADDFCLDITIDPSSNFYVTGHTTSTTFPLLNAIQTTKGTINDAFITKFNSNGTLAYSTYLGATTGDYGSGIAVDNNGNTYVVGYTNATDFPTLNPIQATHSGGGNDMFVAKLTSSGALSYSTYIGGSGSDNGVDIAVDGNGTTYITGHTNSTNFPMLNASQSSNAGGYDVIVLKLTSTGALTWSTYLGGGNTDYGDCIAIDGNGNTYITGMTASTNFPTLNALLTSPGGGNEAFVAKLSSSGARVYSTYFGGNKDDNGTGIAVDGSGSAFISGTTASTSNFPTLNAAQPGNNGREDFFIARLSDGPLVDLLGPPATAAWCAGTTQPIIWISGGVTNVAIDISSNGGATWTTLTPSFPAYIGGYSWVIPSTQPAGSNYRVRIRDAANAAVFDASSTGFTIQTAPVATITSEAAPVATAFTTVVITSDATGSPAPAVQWQSSSNGVDYTDLPGERSSTLTLASVSAAEQGRYYRALYSNPCGSSATPGVLLTVEKAPATVKLGSLNHLYDGTAKAATATTTPAGLTVDITYALDGTPVPAPTEPGSYAVTATIRDANYAGSATGTLVIARTTATIALSNLNHVYDGNVKTAIATTTPGGLRVDISYTLNGTPVTAPVNAGSYEVTATIRDTNYIGAATGTLVIEKAAGTITLSNLLHEFDGTAKAATATTTPAGLAVDISYAQNGTPVSAPTLVGTYEATAVISEANYEGSANGILVIEGSTSAPGERGEAMTGMSARMVPNPLGDRGELHIDGLAPGRLQVTIHDITGRSLKRIEAVATRAGELVLPIDMAGLPAGFYTVRIVTAPGSITVRIQVGR